MSGLRNLDGFIAEQIEHPFRPVRLAVNKNLNGFL
jgi:hypothetical protein